MLKNGYSKIESQRLALKKIKRVTFLPWVRLSGFYRLRQKNNFRQRFARIFTLFNTILKSNKKNCAQRTANHAPTRVNAKTSSWFARPVLVYALIRNYSIGIQRIAVF